MRNFGGDPGFLESYMNMLLVDNTLKQQIVNFDGHWVAIAIFTHFLLQLYQDT
jgi:hypothetical protein